MSRRADVDLIREALEAAAEAVRPFTPGDVAFSRKEARGDPVTEADRAADRVLRRILPLAGEGWLSEESVDDAARLGCRRVWVVDPIDGTREFVEGLPEWCISIGLLEDGLPVAGGIYNPATEELMLGSLETGVEYNGVAARVTDPAAERLGALTAGGPGEPVAAGPGRPAAGGPIQVLASRSEVRRGEWARFEGGPFAIRACGSVAFKMALVAAGRADATWTLVPKSEWDVAAGTALVRAAGGVVTLADGGEPRFNKAEPLFPNFVAAGRTLGALLVEDLLGVVS